MKNGKIWGNTQEIFTKNNVSIHRITANKNSSCSKHLHNHKYNIFFIEKGKLLIKHWQNDYNLVDETILVDGEMCSIPPMHYHQFIALEDTVAYEIYYVEIEEKDITRETCGSSNYEIHTSSQQQKT
jgi:mannose-6-phosphate isomerase-like protein (cupin superfamily)